MQGNTILLKQDNGSYQLLRISPAQPGGQAPSLTPTGGSTIRLQTVPAVSRFPGPTLALRKTILTQQVKQNKQNVNSHHNNFFLICDEFLLLFWSMFNRWLTISVDFVMILLF
jgi:hypothetical protein